jgi:hypothetical protein
MSVEYTPGCGHSLYDFKQLSPADFEDLICDLLQLEWDVRLEAFKSGRDNGIDLRYAAVQREPTIIQCKHYSGSNISNLIQHLRLQELPKIRRLSPGRYVLVTSLPLNPADKEKIQTTLSPFIQTPADIFGGNDVNNLLGRHSEIETKHFKLWMSSTHVLQRVLHNAEKVQTEFNVERVRRAIPLYVQTSNYNRALAILEEHRCVFISGVPGIGKTTLADMLLFAHLESGYLPVVINSEISEGRRLFNDELGQIFYFDDFLGQTFLGNRFDFLGKKEDSAILEFIEIISRSRRSRLILTTREHVLQHAFQISEYFRRQKGGLATQRCILELSDYTLLDRGRILYNHVYFSDLPWPYKAQLLTDAFYMEILRHRNFNPRLVEWLSKYTNVKGLASADYRAEVKRVLDNPEQLWRIAFEQQISEGSRSILLALYSLGGAVGLDRLQKAWKTLHQLRARKYNWKTAPEDWRRSLQDLEGGFLKFESQKAAFVNPSVRDFFDTVLASDTDHLEDVLSAACFFEQVVNVWSLAKSEKGKHLRQQLRGLPDQLIAAVNQNLNTPYEQNVSVGPQAYGTRVWDVRPEVRLLTMLSIADSTKATAAWGSVVDYAQTLVGFWSKHSPDFRATVEVLQALDGDTWKDLERAELHEHLKSAILGELSEVGESDAFDVLVDYAQSKGARWTDQDRESVIRAFTRYLEKRFDQEFGNYDTEDELQDLSQRLRNVGDWCDVDVQSYDDQIDARLADMESAREDEERRVQQWDSANQLTPEYVQETEVRRLFDGLRQSAVIDV